MRPLLKPALRRLWRDPGTLQLGLDPAYAVAVAGVERRDSGLLELLDGTRASADLLDEAARRGFERERAGRLLQTLASAAVLDDGTTPAGADPSRQPDLLSLSLVQREPGAARRAMATRSAATVEVLGAGRVGASIAMVLAAAGVGHLAVVDRGRLRPVDYAPAGVRGPQPRQADRAGALRALLGAAGARAGAGSIVVLAPASSVIPPEWLRQVRTRPHLPVTIRETTAFIGPLVLPGRTPCLRCVELGRGDRDPVWPVLAAQLVGAPPPAEPCDIALASAAASIAALHVLAYLDRRTHEPARPPTVGGVLELSLADLRLRRRTIAAHPGCGCGAGEIEPGAA